VDIFELTRQALTAVHAAQSSKARRPVPWTTRKRCTSLLGGDGRPGEHRSGGSSTARSGRTTDSVGRGARSRGCRHLVAPLDCFLAGRRRSTGHSTLTRIGHWATASWTMTTTSGQSSSRDIPGSRWGKYTLECMSLSRDSRAFGVEKTNLPRAFGFFHTQHPRQQ
jgi:hypothetical protein